MQARNMEIILEFSLHHVPISNESLNWMIDYYLWSSISLKLSTSPYLYYNRLNSGSFSGSYLLLELLYYSANSS